MVYATGTTPNSSAYPARDFMNAVRTPLLAAGFTLADQIGTPTSGTWRLASGVPSQFPDGGVYAAICAGTATAVTSTDAGATWTRRDLPVAVNWTALAYGNNIFTAIASGSVHAVYSSDGGTTWNTSIMPAPEAWSAITYGAGLFVALTNGSTGVYATSADGITWTPRTMLPGVYNHITYGGGQFLTSSGTTVLTSPDGITWTSRGAVLPAAAGFSVYNTNTVPGAFILAPSASTANIYWSNDSGVTWNTRALPSTVTPTGMVNSASYVHIVTSTGQLLTNATPQNSGSAWSTQNSGQTSPSLAASTMPSGQYAAVPIFSNVGTYIVALGADAALSGRTTQTQTFSHSAAPYADVYAMAAGAAGNSTGKAWYLILRRATDAATAISYQVAETYSARKASNYGGTGQNVAPSASTFLNPAPAANADTITAASASIVISTAGQPTQWWVSATGNRVVIAARSTTTETAFYAGMIEDLLPSGQAQYPLVCARFPVAQNAAGGIGTGSALNAGGFTREPNQSSASAGNFDAAIHNGYLQGSSASGAWTGYTPITTFSALYGNAGLPARVPIGSTRVVSSYADAIRGLLYDVVLIALPAAIGDQVTAGSKTWTRMAGPLNVTNFGYYVDASV